MEKIRRTIPPLYNKFYLFIIVMAVILGIGIFISPGVFTLIAIFPAFIFYISRRHRKKVVYIFMLAIILRIILSFLHVFIGYASGIGSDLIGDSVGYSGGGAYVAEVLTNKSFEKSLIADELANLMRFRKTYKGFLPNYNDWRVDGYSYYLGLIYAVFGYSPITVKLINSLFMIVAVYIIYRYLLRHFGEQVGFYFLVISLFLPSLFFWSISGVKDQVIWSFFILGIFSLIYLIESGKIWGIILAEGILLNLPLLFLIGGLFLLFKNDRVVITKIIGCALLIIFSVIGMNSMRQLASTLFYYIFQLLALFYLFLYLLPSRLFRIGIVLSMILFMIAFPVKELMFNAYKKFTYQSIAKTMVCQYDATTNYQIYPERYNSDEDMKRIGFSKFKEPSIPEFIIMTLKGFAYALFSPLAWSARSKAELLASFEGHLMVISFFLVANGIFLCCRRIEYFTFSLPIVIPFLAFLVLLTFFEGNVGTLFRHKSMVLPFYCALLAIGLGGKPGKTAL